MSNTNKNKNHEMPNHINNKSQHKTAIIVGALFLIALFADLLESYISENESLSIIAMFLELIAGAAMIGIGAIMFPILKPHNKILALGYLICRSIEGAIFIVSVIFIFSSVIFLIYVYVFGIGALMLYCLLYQSKLVPRFISIWGLIAITILLVANILGLLDYNDTMKIFFGLPIMLNEIFLSIWLIVKGFNSDAIAFGAAKKDMNNK